MGLGDFVSNIFGSTNEFQAKAPDLDPNAYQYGGHAGGAEEAAALQGARAQRSTVTANQLQAQQGQMFGRGNESLDQAGQARNEQLGALGLARARATGQAPSIATMTGDRYAQKLAAGQASAAASARGPAALALAQQNAAANTATGTADIAGQTSIAAAQERLAAEQSYAQQAAGLRQGDVGQAQTAFGAGAQSGQLAIGNQQVGQGWAGLQNDINKTQLAAQMNQQAQKSANELAAQGINAGVAGQNAGTNQANAFGTLGLGASIASGAAAGPGGGGGGGSGFGSDERMKAPLTSVPSTWGSGPSPSNVVLAPSTWGTGAGTTGLDMQREEAAGAIRQMVSDERNAGLSGSGGMAVPAATEPLVRADQEQLGLLQARQRQGDELTPEEQQKMSVLTRRVGQAKQGEKPVEQAAKAAEPKKEEPTKTQKAFGAAKTAFDKMAEGAGTYTPSLSYAAPQMVALPTYQAPAITMNSDERAKVPLLSTVMPGVAGVSSGVGMGGGSVGAPTFDQLSAGGGMNVMGSLAQHSKVGTQFISNPGAGMIRSDMGTKVFPSDMGAKAPIVSDMGAKTYPSDERAKFQTPEIQSLYEPPGQQLHMDPSGRSYLVAPQMFAPMTVSSGGDGGLTKVASRSAKSDAGKKERAPTLDEASAWADRELGATKAKTEGLSRARPTIDPMADANRSMAASPYAYKPEFKPPEQVPGEPNVGPMAQNMAANPIAATAVRQDPQTGLLSLDRDKMLKVVGGGVASLQDQVDDLRNEVQSKPSLSSRRKKDEAA